MAALSLWNACACAGEPSKVPASDVAAQHVERFASIPAFVKLLASAEHVRLFVGIPRAAAPGAGENEKLKDLVAIRGFKFFDKHQALAPEQLRTIHLKMVPADTFDPYSGPKFCGGFHPDYLLEWQSGKTRYQALFCFGCSEIRWFGTDDYEVWCDMSESGRERLRAAFSNLSQPTVTKE